MTEISHLKAGSFPTVGQTSKMQIAGFGHRPLPDRNHPIQSQQAPTGGAGDRMDSSEPAEPAGFLAKSSQKLADLAGWSAVSGTLTGLSSAALLQLGSSGLSTALGAATPLLVGLGAGALVLQLASRGLNAMVGQSSGELAEPKALQRGKQLAAWGALSVVAGTLAAPVAAVPAAIAIVAGAGSAVVGTASALWGKISS